MKSKLIASAILLGLTAGAAHATSLNIRHEFIPEEGERSASHKDRLLMSHLFDNGIGISEEVKWGYENDSVNLGEMKSAGHETKIGYNYKINDEFKIQPAYAMDSSSSSITHKFDLKGVYKISDSWNASLRYRYGMKVPSNDSPNSHYSQVNLVTAYQLNSDYKVGIDIEGKFEQSASSGYDGNKNYLNLVNLFGEYQGFESGWRPFIELGMTSQETLKSTPGKDQYVTRYRIGLKYNF
ncbi:oligogalacturonate-specific porin KdgM family protein [Vibrio mangrovi]|uniref:Oligogalacturonate-specific porin KdgM n=1 Tax=Vibrio mangrovi TaxID=474394 RepID=A0A1Y6IRC0_9VIBR|nr:oligogalacturonate-specific porin KdgM family protein [Vibrio mangrovi]MDW6001798.1 oligogalacturonate-specific porin KdgM family protein [Vibrio mangrovi]SMS00176.1 Oligogalacturonate-specific porin KdgM precursor [Vibrio mangrovi]